MPPFIRPVSFQRRRSMRNKVDSPNRKSCAEPVPSAALPSDEGHRHRQGSAPHRWTRICFFPLLAFLFISLYVSHQHLHSAADLTSSESRDSGRPLLPHTPSEVVPVNRAGNRTHIPGVGFALLGLGPFARQLKCEAAVESLRAHGGWDGAIFLYTDAPRCFTQNSIWTECSIDAHIIDVQDDLASGFTMPSFYKTRGNRLRSKKYKTRIFELMPDPEIEILIYMDCDMLVAGETLHGLEEFVLDYKDSFSNDTQIFVFPENNPSQINGIVHTGIFIAHRTWSAAVLQRWATQLDTEKDASDQAAFIRAEITEYAFIDEYKYLYRPRCDRDNCYSMKPLLFNHINGARCWSQGKKEIQVFVNRWDLCSYRRHNYCFPWYMTQFAMSWMPYTSCAKMEEKRSPQ